MLDKECKSWELFNYIEAQVKNMMSSLRAVSELQNPAIRDRHWQQLMAETRVNKLRVFTKYNLLNNYVKTGFYYFIGKIHYD